MTYNDDRNRYPSRSGSNNTMIWVGGLLGVLLIIGGIMWALNGNHAGTTASGPVQTNTTTTGQGPASTPTNTGRSPAKQNPPSGPVTAPNP
jgi:hypothetical protein